MSVFLDHARALRARIDQALEQAVPDTPGSQLAEAMRYALAGGGKRIRPLLLFAGFRAVRKTADHPALDTAAAALEAMHAYSLVHDDLPAMDDDELRRGKPTCHIAFDEALAILTGDALQTLAFELLCETPGLDDTIRLALVRTLARASGLKGMVVGQAIDLAAVDTQPNTAELEHMHRCKTGALIDASVRMGALIGGASESELAALAQYSRALGLAFQVQDDILDVTADTGTLGKRQGADEARNKPTYVSLLGLEEARRRAQALYLEALEALDALTGDAGELRLIAQYVVEREH
ncbi:polyprenyl synthetase family protein [Gilvimarinus algae]|uniref:Polyprenyl synthetase family protein n=1 Tax=Gilvimarinus algae TaxID=3058037 RepID=A0ABT8TGZ5_9GAMM|nr:farnesyl diphosphate synthase [Gilvimarinus sp. SDUM040014]MDO3383369.1 polyprenyl synthetase family protein [Gilvimarinus sp. SDUM040014]